MYLTVHSSGNHHWSPQVRDTSAAGDAVPTPPGTEGRRRGPLLRQRRQLQPRFGVVPPQDATFIQGPSHHREKSFLLRHARGRIRTNQFSSTVFTIHKHNSIKLNRRKFLMQVYT